MGDETVEDAKDVVHGAPKRLAVVILAQTINHTTVSINIHVIAITQHSQILLSEQIEAMGKD